MSRIDRGRRIPSGTTSIGVPMKDVDAADVQKVDSTPSVDASPSPLTPEGNSGDNDGALLAQHVLDNGSGEGNASCEDYEAYRRYFEDNGWPFPYKGSTTLEKHQQLQKADNYDEILNAWKNAVKNTHDPNAVDAFFCSISDIAENDNVLELVLIIIVESTKENNSIRIRLFKKLQALNVVSRDYSEQLRVLADASNQLQEGVSDGSDNAEAKKVYVTRFHYSSTLDMEGNPVVSGTHSGEYTQGSLSSEMKLLESYQEELRNKKQMITNKFHHLDQMVNLQMQGVAKVIAAIEEGRFVGAASRSGL